MGVYFQGNGDVQIGKLPTKTSQSSSPYQKIGEILNFIQTKYVDSVDMDHLADVAANAILQELDPNSYYITREQAISVNQRMQGNLEGIGIEFFVFRDSVYVIDVLPDGPAESSVLSKGDIILSVDDSLVSGNGLSLNEIVELFRGESGSKVLLNIYRPTESRKIEVELTRGTVPVNSVGAAYMMDDDLLYIKLNSFTSRSYREFMQAIERNVDENKEFDLILDLRHNPGGYLQEAIKILSQFFRRSGLPLVYTRGSSIQERVYKTSGQNFYRIGKIAVLIDGASASASEIVAGVTQDMDRAIIVGSPSFGKGSVQEHYRLSDQSAMRLTVSRYYIPSGRAIFKSQQLADGADAFYYSEGANDEFLTRNGRRVEQGSAIQPDILVEADSLFTHNNFEPILRIINRLAFVYYLASFQAGQDVESFLSNLSTLPYTWKEDFMELAEEEYGNRDLEEMIYDHSDRISGFLKARKARYFAGSTAYQKVLNEYDPVVRAAIEALENDYQAMLNRSAE